MTTTGPVACTPQTPWRDTGNTTPAAFRAELASSPVAAEADALYDAATPYQRLYLGHSYVENWHDTRGILILPDMHNNLALRPRGYPEEVGVVNGFAAFASYAGCLAAWRRRLVDPRLCYVPAVPLLDYCRCYNPASDTHPITGVVNDPVRYCDRLLTVINRLPLEDTSVPELTFGNVPHPPAEHRWIPDAQNTAWNDLGPRTVKGVVWHRMIGTLRGTDAFFRQMANAQQTGRGALTDYGIGVEAQDGPADDGLIWRWNDPLGAAHGSGAAKVSANRAGWASGPWSASGAFGDGRAFVEDHGGDLNVINRDQASIEISGRSYDVPLSEKSRAAIAGLTAYWADRAAIPWDRFPLVNGEDYSFVRWHAEFCGEAEKPCPGNVVRAETDALIERTAAIMRSYQTGEDAPAPALDYPPGWDAAIASAVWGDAVPAYAFNPEGVVSGIWLTEQVCSPLVFHFKQTGQGTPDFGRELFCYASGHTIGRLGASESFRVLSKPK